ncbi:heme ABC transporter permease/ATP-binding protein CydD [Ferrimonas marina]|uniref:ATP-binding cassette, subfamily C, CydD n=1 Tax=Ferrimonas marina TaxID=299255 RepID=A0A1M5N5E5_9GAMM|nr:cysteine/glutathione ABC transporter permease/ATP-binding protein CydD [Ferrimonas marina]SHG84213.1 ATP-binding cassette, subfamily C, CydD [Ferrimonas marina]
MTEKQSLNWLRKAAHVGRHWAIAAVLAGYGNALLLILQAWILASLLHGQIIDQEPLSDFYPHLTALALLFPLRGALLWLKERCGFRAGAAVRQHLRQGILSRLADRGPAHLQQQASGAWTSLLMEQIEQVQEYYSKYLVQTRLVMLIPLTILLVVLPINWAAAVVFVVTAPLTVLFMVVVGMGAADANKRNFLALARLSGHFLDRLKGLATIRLFDRMESEAQRMDHATDQFRRRTMEVLRMAFLSSAVLEFFASVSIAVIAVYFGFSYLGELNFGHYGYGVSLFSGLLVLMLAPDFFQPFRDLGTYYHAKAEAVGAAEGLCKVMEQKRPEAEAPLSSEPWKQLTLEVEQAQALSAEGVPLCAPVSFTLAPGEHLVLAGATGSGKTSLMQALMGLLPYSGSIRVNGQELSALPRGHWLAHLTWLGQNPMLVEGTVRDNLQLAKPDADDAQLNQALQQAYASEFVDRLPGTLEYRIQDGAGGLSVGQAQRLALARALLKPAPLLLLDEPTASLDSQSEQWVQQSLVQFAQGRSCITITHRQQQQQQGDKVITLLPMEDRDHA